MRLAQIINLKTVQKKAERSIKMKDYKTNNYKGYKSSPELAFIAITLAYIVTSMSIEEISQYFGF